MATDNHGSCSNCGSEFNGGSIWLTFYDQELKKQVALGAADAEADALAATEADRVAEMFGATRNKGRWGRQIGLSDGDGVYAYKCPDCGYENVFNPARKARFEALLAERDARKQLAGAGGETPSASTTA